jgi:hypothetical protein
MPERKIRIPYPTPVSPMMDGVEVSVKESTERWTDILLDDGTQLRLKANVLSAVRIVGEYDPEGNPMYALKAGQTLTILSSPENLRRPTPGSKGVN